MAVSLNTVHASSTARPPPPFRNGSFHAVFNPAFSAGPCGPEPGFSDQRRCFPPPSARETGRPPGKPRTAPARVAAPPVGRRNPARIFSGVDFPQPLGPRMQNISPAPAVKVISSKTVSSPSVAGNAMERSRVSKTASSGATSLRPGTIFSAGLMSAAARFWSTAGARRSAPDRQSGPAAP